MKKIIILLTVFLIFALGFIALETIKTLRQVSLSTIASPSPSMQKQNFVIKGSIPYWDQEKAVSTFVKNVNVFDYINLFWYYLSEHGDIMKYSYANEDKSIIDFAHENNVKAFAVITNLPEFDGASWDSERVENAIKDNINREKHVENIVKKINEINFDGVTIDYEEVKASQKDNFSSFIEELSIALHKKRKMIAVALHPKINSSDSGNGAFQNWKDLAKYADQLNIMAYGEHWDESSAGPIASTRWVEKIINYTKTLNIPSEKFILGIPLYGYDWNKNDESKAKDLTYKDVLNLLTEFDKEEQWSSESASPYFFYNDNGDTHEVWFENSRSVEEKIKIAKKAGFGGITFWRLGEEDPDIWKIISSLR